MNNQLHPPPRRPLRNETCPYCGVVLDRDTAVREHVVGRRFVPRNKFSNSWNLILRACASCNGRKSDLEDDISAISMLLPRALIGETDEYVDDVKRKAAKSYSRRTGKPVAESKETTMVHSAPLPGVSMKATMVAPPQIDEQRAYELACMQLAAFFYAITYDPDSRRGGCWLGGFCPVAVTAHSDWGNLLHRWFMTTVVGWEPRLIGLLAGGFYRVAIRRNPQSIAWSWALEWNKTVRLIGFFGDEEPIRAIAKEMPHMQMHPIGRGTSSYFRVRLEVPLADDDDVLFYSDQELPAC